MMDSKLLTLLKVIECGSYTQAANQLHLTQPAVTQHIQKLEAQLGCSLFCVQGRTLSLTYAGRIVEQHAHLQQALEHQLISRLNGVVQPLALGMTLSIADYALPEALMDTIYQGGYSCSIEVGNTEVMVKRLIEGTLDCALIEGLFQSDLFVAHQFCKARFIGVVSSTHPLANQAVTLEQLFQYPLVLREQGSGTREILRNWLRGQNDDFCHFTRQFEMGSFKMIKQFVEKTESITFVYEQVVQKEIKEGKLIELRLNDFDVERAMQFVYLKNSVQCEEYENFYHRILQTSTQDNR